MFFATPIIHQRTYSARSDDAALQRFMQSATQAQSLKADFQVAQTDDATTLSVDVPGLARDQLQLRLEDNLVHLHSVEGAPRSVHRSWELPHHIDPAASSAKLEHGVLHLTLARLKPVDKKVTLEIQ